jgi:importin subunit alpha-1
MRNTSWCLANLCRGKPAPDFEKIKIVIPSLVRIVKISNNDDTIMDVLWALSYISCNE